MEFLAVPASSAPVVRLYSVAGKFFRPERCWLTDNTFKLPIFIHCNNIVKGRICKIP
jgi:hypothetical protein